jgi:hypothetical protein
MLKNKNSKSKSTGKIIHPSKKYVYSEAHTSMPGVQLKSGPLTKP